MKPTTDRPTLFVPAASGLGNAQQVRDPVLIRLLETPARSDLASFRRITGVLDNLPKSKS